MIDRPTPWMCLLLALVVCSSGTVHATSLTVLNPASLTILNPSFESTKVPTDGNSGTVSNGDDFVTFSSLPLADWQVSGSDLASLGHLTRVAPTFFTDKLAPTPDPTDHEQTHWANRSDKYIYQVLPTTITAGATYRLRVDLGDRTDTPFPENAQIRLGYGNTAGINLLTPATQLKPIPPNGGWSTWESTFTIGPGAASVGQPLRIELISAMQQAGFDNVRLDVVTDPAHPQALPVSNYSFETPLVPTDGDPNTVGIGDDFTWASINPIDGWMAAGSVEDAIGQLTRGGSFYEDKLAPTPDGAGRQQSHWSDGPDTFLYQVLSEPLAAGTIYRLVVDLGNRTDTEFPAGTEIRLGFGSTPSENLLTADSVFDPDPPDGGWSTWESVFITAADPAGLGQPLRVELISGGSQAQFDNVRLEAVPVPEPSTWLLSAIGLCCLLGRPGRRLNPSG